jgi:DNA processing protein
MYPSGHEELAHAIARQGAVIAELPPGAPPLRHHFPLRNRLISGLSAAVVVVEARARSGSLITAEHALEQGREVLAVPGAVDAATSVGSNLLLRQGAPPALDASDVLRSLAGTAAAAPTPPSAARPTPTPSHPILRALLEEAATRDELARRLGCPSSKLARELLLLELEGRIVEDRDGRLRAVWDAS